MAARWEAHTCACLIGGKAGASLQAVPPHTTPVRPCTLCMHQTSARCTQPSPPYPPHLFWLLYCMQAVQTHITGGGSYAVLLDAQAHAQGSACTVDGPVHINEHAPPAAAAAAAACDHVMSEATPAHACAVPHKLHVRAGGHCAAAAAPLVDVRMVPADAAVAAAAFPTATGPFVWEQPSYGMSL